MLELAMWATGPRICAYCGGTAQGNSSIHRDGFGVGPEVDLCDGCGLGLLPTCEEIWDHIALPADDDFAHRKLQYQQQTPDGSKGTP